MGKKYVKTVYCHLAYLTYMQSTSWETLGWMKHKLESRLLGEISITSVPSSRGPSWPRNWTPISCVSCIAGRFFTHWATWEAVADKGPSSQSCGFSSNHVRMWELDHKEGWVPKNYAFKLVLEKTIESLLDCREIKPANPKGIFIGRTDAEAETPVLWSPDTKSWFIWKDPDAGKDWGQEKGTTEDEMVGWHYWLGLEFKQALGDVRSLVRCCPRSLKESDTT